MELNSNLIFTPAVSAPLEENNASSQPVRSASQTNDEILNWDESLPPLSERERGTIKVKLKYAGFTQPIFFAGSLED